LVLKFFIGKNRINILGNLTTENSRNARIENSFLLSIV
jgi:hypothetical protein